MNDIIDEFLRHDHCRTSAPAGESDIEAVTDLFGAPLPDALVRLWRSSDGVALDSIDAHILGPAEVLESISVSTMGPTLVEAGFVPLLDDHESNYLAVIVREPLAFRVNHIPHDDGSRLLYHDIASCLRALLEGVGGDDPATLILHETEGDYTPGTIRSEEDHRVARTLLATMPEGDYWGYAAQLLDAGNLREWAILLDTGHFVRRDVLERMRRIDSPGIRELLREDEESYEEFARRLTTAAREAGLEVGRRQGTALQIGARWFELDGFFHQRGMPRALARSVAWMEEVINDRDPRQRDPHFTRK